MSEHNQSCEQQPDKQGSDADREPAYRGKTVLITGASGFIGRHLVQALEEQNATVVTERIEVTDSLQVEAAIERWQPEIVFHLAASLRRNASAEALLAQTSVTMGGAFNMVSACLRQEKCHPHLVQVGSSEEYGDGPVPFQETQPLRPPSPYAVAKSAASRFVLAAVQTGALSALVVRPTVVYGPGQIGSMLIPSLMRAYLGNQAPRLSNGEQTRDFLYIDDLVAALLQLGLRRDLSGQVFNLGSGRAVKVKSVAELAAKICAYKGELGLGSADFILTAPGLVTEHCAAIEKAQRSLSWTPLVDLESGLSLTAKWWRTQPACHSSTD